MNKIGKNILLFVYVLIVILVTIYLFAYNSFGFSKIGNQTIFVSNEIDGYSNGSLVFAKADNNNIKIGDSVLLYNVYNASYQVISSKVVSITQTNEKEITYELSNDKYLSSSYLIGNKKDSVVIPLLGYAIAFLSSSEGYLLFAVMPILLMFIIQLRILVNELKPDKKVPSDK